MGDLSGGLGVDPRAGRGWSPAASGRTDLGVGRSTVARAVASQRPPKYERRPVPTSFIPFESLVRAILAEHSEMPATVIAERDWLDRVDHVVS